MVTKVLYIDDEAVPNNGEAQAIANYLNLPGEFECVVELPPKNFSALSIEQLRSPTA